MMTQLLALAQSGGLDGALLAQGRFYQTDYTKPLLFLADGTYLEDLARAQHLGGDQWGMMNETGNYPGQAWLWLYTFWYQVKPFSTSGNADALVWSLMALLTLVVRARAVHPRRAIDPETHSDLPADLAKLLPGRRGPRR